MCILECVTFLFICRDFVLGNGNSYSRGALIHTNPVRITDHGMYQCRYSGCADSYIGQLNVEGELYDRISRPYKVIEFYHYSTPISISLNSICLIRYSTIGFLSSQYTIKFHSNSWQQWYKNYFNIRLPITNLHSQEEEQWWGIHWCYSKWTNIHSELWDTHNEWCRTITQWRLPDCSH